MDKPEVDLGLLRYLSHLEAEGLISIITVAFWSKNHQIQFVVVKSKAHEGSLLCSAWPLTGLLMYNFMQSSTVNNPVFS